MTAQELIKHFNETFGTNKWPEHYVVDHETYANCCQYIFDKAEFVIIVSPRHLDISVVVGVNRGLMVKNVQLILENK